MVDEGVLVEQAFNNFDVALVAGHHERRSPLLRLFRVHVRIGSYQVINALQGIFEAHCVGSFNGSSQRNVEVFPRNFLTPQFQDFRNLVAVRLESSLLKLLAKRIELYLGKCVARGAKRRPLRALLNVRLVLFAFLTPRGLFPISAVGASLFRGRFGGTDAFGRRSYLSVSSTNFFILDLHKQVIVLVKSIDDLLVGCSDGGCRARSLLLLLGVALLTLLLPSFLVVF